jgi:hypothetical protein
MDTATKLERLRGVDTPFARSLYQAATSERGASEKQWFWIDKLTAEPPYAGIVEFMPPNGHVKLGHGFKLVRAKAGSSVFINGPEGREVRYSFINSAGQLVTPGGWTPLPGEVIELLDLFESDPEGFAAKYGREHGECCFCALELTHERSIGRGYGPKCAKKYGLVY